MRVLIALSFLSVVSGEYFEGYRLDAPLLESLKVVGLRSCCKECSAYTNCKSVNYNKDDFSCELNYHHVSGLPGKSALNESVYMDRAHCFTLASCSAVSKQLLQVRIKTIFSLPCNCLLKYFWNFQYIKYFKVSSRSKC